MDFSVKSLFNKKSFGRNYLIVDAGMNDLMRPALYNSYHKILNISTKNQDFDKYDVVGPVCESSDVFATNYNLPISLRNDIIVICSTGAYGESMSSNYNLRNSIKILFFKFNLIYLDSMDFKKIYFKVFLTLIVYILLLVLYTII